MARVLFQHSHALNVHIPYLFLFHRCKSPIVVYSSFKMHLASHFLFSTVRLAITIRNLSLSLCLHTCLLLSASGSPIGPAYYLDHIACPHINQGINRYFNLLTCFQVAMHVHGILANLSLFSLFIFIYDLRARM